MDRGLLLKILGKEYSIKLEDAVYNLREITDEIRSNISFNIEFFDDDKHMKRLKIELEAIYKVLEGIIDYMNLAENNIGYTNSRNYIRDYISRLCINIDGLNEVIIPFNDKKVIYYNNMIADLVLKY